ncbi:serine-rich adhesin for platelets isoform X2 [Eupeodes corollae]|uniref:serine-rich adhesin for platelets isoform X2 n=1 Tax=Eupeodes corollae TaxID=290404 RepID=UPI0024904CFE|nr:serine-rich adhesin for platelets isoform X2 [Eupeodes corollae]
MNSVISAFKAKKASNGGTNGVGGGGGGGGGTATTTTPNITTCNNEKNHRSSNNNSNHSTPNGKKLNLSSQENGYQYLRHIREIDTATKMLSSVALSPDDLLEGDKMNFRPRMCVDVVDHATIVGPPQPASIIEPLILDVIGSNNCNNLSQQNCDTAVSTSSSSPHRTGSSCTVTEDDDESSSAACTSSSSELSQSTVIVPTQTLSSPAKSLSGSISYSSCSNSSSSCDITTIVDTPSTNTETTVTTASANSTQNECSNSMEDDLEESTSPIAVLTAPNSPSSSAAARTTLPSSVTLKTPPTMRPMGGSNITLPIIMPNENSSLGSCNGTQGTSNSATTTPKSARYSKPRLSLSRFVNHSMPSVHGRPNANGMNGNVGGANGVNGTTTNGGQPKRLSTHQRNLSLDFRSMGILLPPVSQVTNTRINLTQHHRNRSLDSALQRIPEVEVSSPNAESENTFCTNSILGSTMCSKIVTSTVSSNSPISSTCIVDQSSEQQCKLSSLTSSTSLSTASSGNSSVIVEPCSRTKSSESSSCNNNISSSSSSNKLPIVVPLSKVAVVVADNNNSKKREDLTSLGSDDSGIICGSESDQVSLNRIRQSHESLDSGEMDAEEECIEILDTTSMDEEYGMLQSDLCFYQSPDTDCQTLRPRKKHDERTTPTSESMMSGENDRTTTRYNVENNRICVPICINNSPSSPVPNDSGSDLATPTSPSSEENILPISTTTSTTGKAAAAQKANDTLEPANKSEHIRNEVLFKNFFGATKNAIFRTAQSIIENHEKKNAAKIKAGEHQDNASIVSGDIKSPTEISKKKEFLRLISSNGSKKAAAAAAIKINSPTEEVQPLPMLTVTPVGTTPTEPDVKPSLIKSSGSMSSLNRLKAVPGVVKCFVREKEPLREPTKTEKGPNGLLRFFESPVFNIHFAIHYLFYSKEPGVLSFIGNKIFSFPDQEVDLYIPQLIVMYIQMDELAEVLDPYLTIRCRKSVDFSLKCLWLLEAYNYQIDSNSLSSKKTQLALMKEIFSKKERKQLKTQQVVASPVKKTHHRSQSDATVLLSGSRLSAAKMPSLPFPSTPAKLCLGDLTSGRAFDNGCTCFESVRGTVNDLLGHKTVCMCGAPKSAPQKEFMKALINVGKNLTSLTSKAEKTSALRMFLNLINKNLPARVWLPLYSDIPHHVVRITEEKTAVLNSKDKTPYIIYVEVVEVNDIYSSPVILKMMPSLRHTKSEEHLELKDCCSNSGIAGAGKTSESSTESHTALDTLLHSCLDDVWSQEDDEITAQYLNMRKQLCERDSVSQMSLDSCDSRDQGIPALFNIGDVRTRHCNSLSCENTKSFSNDPEDPSAAALKEPWHEKEKQIRDSSPYGHLSNWRLLSAIVKCGDDLRQELMATQLLQMFKIIWDEENVDLWVRPYKIVCLSNDSGLIEPILNTVSLHQIKKNSNKSLRDYFIDEYGDAGGEKFRTAQKNFVQSCAAYCLISYLLQVKDRHNGNILLHSDGHLIHIDFGFILSISPKNLGFEQSPFKLTPEFVDVMDGTSSDLWTEFNRLLLVGMMTARKHMDRIINFVEIMRSNAFPFLDAQLPCFKNGCSGTVQNLRKRFHMNLTEQEMERKVEQLVQDSLKSLSTKLYDGYQYYTNGIL